MCCMPLKITDRIKRVKETYAKLPVASLVDGASSKSYRTFGTGDRWITLAYLRGWEKHANQPTVRMRAACAEAENLYHAKPVIYDDELLLGHLYLPEYTEEEQAEYDRLYESFKMSPYKLYESAPRKCHIGLDFETLLEKGIDGIIADVEKRRKNSIPLVICTRIMRCLKRTSFMNAV